LLCLDTPLEKLFNFGAAESLLPLTVLLVVFALLMPVTGFSLIKTQNSADRDLNASQNLEKYAQMAKPCLDVKASTQLGFNLSACERASNCQAQRSSQYRCRW
jgi:hypothetical protein